MIKIKPAKNLTKEQKDQLGIKGEGEPTTNLTTEMKNVNINGDSKKEESN